LLNHFLLDLGFSSLPYNQAPNACVIASVSEPLLAPILRCKKIKLRRDDYLPHAPSHLPRLNAVATSAIVFVREFRPFDVVVCER
jgi:hypothetical protein